MTSRSVRPARPVSSRPGSARRSAPDRPGRETRGRILPAPAQTPPTGSREDFTTTWWGAAWIEAFERGATAQARLARGRTYARGGYVAGATVDPGRIVASVRGSRPRPYRAVIRLLELTDEEWDAFLDVVAARPADIAALLDRDMPPGLLDAAAAAGVRLLPAGGEPAPSCSCPDDGHPCKHAAALAYETARFLDDDPFLLFLLRGRGEQEIFEELARRNALYAADVTERRTAAADVPTVSAREALAGTARPALPAPLPPPSAPGEPPALPDAPGRPVSGHRAASREEFESLDADALTFLATDAATRAHASLTGKATGTDAATGIASGPLHRLSLWQDAARTAATHPRLTGRGTFSPLFARLAESAGGTATDLARAAAAWRQGGEAGLAVLDEPWDPPAGDFDRARSALAAAGLHMTIDRNRLCAGRLQLRYGRDGRWYRYVEGPGDGHWPEGPAADDPVEALRNSPAR
jgi:uncharacterized Zn finger protein